MILAVVDIFENTPRIVNLGICEQIAIIPFFYFRQLLLQVIVGKHRFHLCFGEAKAVCVARAQHAIVLQIVEPGKNAFLTDPKAACDDTLLQIRIRLERRLEQGTDEPDHVVVEAMQIGVFQWHIVLVDEDDGIMSVISGKAFRQKPQRVSVEAVIIRDA